MSGSLPAPLGIAPLGVAPLEFGPLGVLLDVIEEPLLLVRSDGTVLDANAAMARQLDTVRQALPGRRLADLLLSPWDKAAAYLQRAGGSRQSTVGVLTFRRAGGRSFGCRCHGNLVQPADESTRAILSLRCRVRSEALSPFLKLNRRLDALRSEITRRRQAEADLQHLDQELEQRVTREVATREQAQARLAQVQRMEALGQLAAGIAHDFNNILQAVSGGLALIQRRADNGDMVRRFSRMAMDAAERGAAITGRLLAFARRGELRAAPTDIRELLAALQEMLIPVLGAAITLRINSAPDLAWLNIDRGQLETALVNVVINARDAMAGGGTVTIEAVPDAMAAANPGGLEPGNYIRLSVADTGTGMDATRLARAAEPFFTTKPVGKGTGLGLAMARGFAQQSGGDLAIESAPGVGTKVTMWFPQPRDGIVGAGSVQNEGQLPEPVRTSRVLLVDDDPLVREVLAGQLEDQGYRIIQASDGLAALAWLDKGEPIDLLITDFAMPGMNGLALLKAVRQRRNTLPALVLTGFADAAVQLAIDGAEGTITALLRKPVRSDELTGSAASLLERGRALAIG
jgi:signal transduction histidine kinase/ActR/RegA family two-component response regulator